MFRDNPRCPLEPTPVNLPTLRSWRMALGAVGWNVATRIQGRFASPPSIAHEFPKDIVSAYFHVQVMEIRCAVASDCRMRFMTASLRTFSCKCPLILVMMATGDGNQGSAISAASAITCAKCRVGPPYKKRLSNLSGTRMYYDAILAFI